METAEDNHAQGLKEDKKDTSEKELNKKTKNKLSDPDKLSQQHNIKLNSIIEEVRHSLELDTN